MKGFKTLQYQNMENIKIKTTIICKEKKTYIITLSILKHCHVNEENY